MPLAMVSLRDRASFNKGLLNSGFHSVRGVNCQGCFIVRVVFILLEM